MKATNKPSRSSLSTAELAVAPLTDAYFEAGDFTDAALDAYIAVADARLRLLGWTHDEYIDAVFSPEA